MLEIIIYIYLALNIFIAGMVFKEGFGHDSNLYTFLITLVCLLFGTLILIGYHLSTPLLPLIGWITAEIKFHYLIRFTKHFDKIFLDDDYSEEYPTLAEKLKRAEKLSERGRKQFKRHNRIIQEKYGR